MKILCTAVVALSLVSVCQPASLACNNLLTPVEKNPELLGRWHLIAWASESCLVTTLFNTLVWPSLAMDVTSTAKLNTYDYNIKVKMYGYCYNETQTFFYENSKMLEVDSNNSPTGDPDVLLQTSCSDCIIVKSKDTIDTLLLLSRRKSISETELKEFEIQTQCLGWSTMKMLNTEFDFDNCKIIHEDLSDEEAETMGLNILSNMSERISNMYYDIYYCIKNKLQSYFL
ncbi:uncharacterized protein LOC101172895 [Oryzias latipes]|uniref:uncharacterized protein LOC101172895 n=1 Tax=Oryzias latipes TaxID=8090 RepID=UPI0000E9D010|nr:uncharacterized protein LOC101172895 [Oryzias latipes]